MLMLWCYYMMEMNLVRRYVKN